MNYRTDYHRPIKRRKRADKKGVYQLNDECSPVILGHLDTLREIATDRHSRTCSIYYKGEKYKEQRVKENKVKHILVLLENSLILLTSKKELEVTEEGIELLEKHKKQKPSQESLTDEY